MPSSGWANSSKSEDSAQGLHWGWGSRPRTTPLCTVLPAAVRGDGLGQTPGPGQAASEGRAAGGEGDFLPSLVNIQLKLSNANEFFMLPVC